MQAKVLWDLFFAIFVTVSDTVLFGHLVEDKTLATRPKKLSKLRSQSLKLLRMYWVFYRKLKTLEMILHKN